jgi:hypothetical protein
MAGRKPGTPKTGGRTKGTPNKVTAAKAAEVAASGLTPLDYLLSILRDETQAQDERKDAAKAAAPYCHPKRAPVDGDGKEASLTVIVNKA